MICPHCRKETDVPYAESQRDQWFDEFWPIMWKRYPQAQPKKPAREAYRRAIKTEAEHQLAMAAARRAAPIEGAKEGRFRPMAATWINQRRWEDEPTSVNRPRGIACEKCGDSGQLSSVPDLATPDIMAFAPCSCARGKDSRILEGIYSLATGERIITCKLCGDTGIVCVPERIVQGLRQDAHWVRCSCSVGLLPRIVLPTTNAPF